MEAKDQLRTFLPDLITTRNELMVIREKFSKVDHYKKFKFGQSIPSIVPLQELLPCYQILIQAKVKLFVFKKKFDENKLPNHTRKVFMEIFLSLGNIKKYNLTAESIMLEGTDSLGEKSLRWVLDNWNTATYEQRVRYSQNAFKFVDSHFSLIRQINRLEKLLN